MSNAPNYRARRRRPTETPLLIGTLDGFETWAVGPVVHVVPPIPEDVSPGLKEALARRRTAAFTGRCPCGARVGQPTRGEDGILHSSIVHGLDCPAADDVIGSLLRAEGFA
jgi:hypothetical protein